MPWQFWIDRGGTFTDVVARDPEGRLHVRKLLSENPQHYSDAPMQAIRDLLGLELGSSIPSEQIASIKMGTTLATNALLERKGARVGLLVTKGFGDLLAIGNQDRPDLFALNIQKPQPLAAAVIEIDERVLPDGSIRTPLDKNEVRIAFEKMRKAEVESVAVLFLHSFTNPEHERIVGRISKECGFTQISLSHEVAREIKAVGRGDTTTADAYLTPILKRYIAALTRELGDGSPLYFMQSHGGLARAQQFSGKNAILSGPAGGVVACAHVAKLAGIDKAIGFDMGGTSTDVSRFDGTYERVFEKTVAGIRIKAPMMHIETVAAGGGSILSFNDGRFQAGPESAGANPGPACYRRGGPATITDANVVLGKILPHRFPACFGPNADMPLDPVAARERIEALAKETSKSLGQSMSAESVAAGFARVANENMALPMKEISVARGYDVRDYALVCFGGAGGQHACAIADLLGIQMVVLHPLAGVLSALGMGLADITQVESEAVLKPLSDRSLSDLDGRYSGLELRGTHAVSMPGLAAETIGHIRTVDLRYSGVDAALNLSITPHDTLRDRFEAEHQKLYGFVKPGHAIEIVTIRTETAGHTRKTGDHYSTVIPETDASVEHTDVWFDAPDESGTRTLRVIQTPIYARAAISPHMNIDGPALIIDPGSTIVVDPGWSATVDSHGIIVLRSNRKRISERHSTQRDPVLLEIFNNLFMSIAEQMGKTLERVSHSVNIKERLDFSCAIFGADGELVANAPHIPVHLGAMGESVKALIAARAGNMHAGEVYATNDPYHGGSHLPDVTAMTPIFGTGATPIFYVANRGHHADIGGITPGSMPPFSKALEEEGVVLHNVTLVSEGRFHETALRELLSGGAYPARNLDERISDLKAQIAANMAGVRLLEELRQIYGDDVVQAYTRHVRDNAAECMRNRIAELPDGEHRFVDRLDSGAAIQCAITVCGDRATVDFTGTSPQLEGNLNAPPAVVLAAVLYVFRTLIGKPIPLNGGCMAPIRVIIPEGSLLRPRFPAAVVGGNVETSMRVVDVLYGALGTVAASQGTMNNLTFGSHGWGYYETICGGAGAGPGFHGASAVHTHMTNTRITDPEVLERRYPVILREFSICRGSGGAGKSRGGDGVVRAIEFLEDMSVAILSERRVTQPYGLNGGSPGQPGRNRIARGNSVSELGGHFAIRVTAGDVLIVETPGGGGFGS
jgi:5-oxoprolinase (ATP-hydrolysing)